MLKIRGLALLAVVSLLACGSPSEATDPGSSALDCRTPLAIPSADRAKCTGSCDWLGLDSTTSWCSPRCSNSSECDSATGKPGRYICTNASKCLPACSKPSECPAPFTRCVSSNQGSYCS